MARLRRYQLVTAYRTCPGSGNVVGAPQIDAPISPRPEKLFGRLDFRETSCRRFWSLGLFPPYQSLAGADVISQPVSLGWPFWPGRRDVLSITCASECDKSSSRPDI